MENRSEYISIREIAEHLGICYWTARTVVLNELPHIKLAKAIRIKRSDFEAWLESKKRG